MYQNYNVGDACMDKYGFISDENILEKILFKKFIG